jgi:amino acid transporter
LWGSIVQLASATVLLLLSVFAVVNGALYLLQRRPDEPRGLFEVPPQVPGVGAVVCLALVGVRVATGDWRAPALAGGLLLGILVIYVIVRPKPINERHTAG